MMFAYFSSVSQTLAVVLGAPLRFGARQIIGKTAGRDGSARPRHQVLVVIEIDDRQQRAAERLAGTEQVMQIGAGKVARGWAAALRVERPRILGMVRVLDVDRTEARERQSVTAVARRHDAIEHVDAAGDGLENVGRRA